MADYIPSFYRYVSSITVTAGGSGYNNIPTITITGGGGSGATATATVYSGSITGFTITNKGQGYTTVPTVTITPHSSDTASGATATAVLDAAQGETALETRNKSYTIGQQAPEHIRHNHPTFITFLEKYYSFMDAQYGDVMNHNSDIDFASETFLDKWRGALVSDFPKLLQVDKSFFYKRAKDFYEAKGSKRSIEAWFRILYDENVDITYPYQYVLKPSDGIYNVERAIKIQEAEHGGLKEPLTLEGKKVDLRYYETTGTVTILKTVNASVRRVEKNTYQTNGLTLQRFELILTFDDAGVTTINGPGAGAVFTANVNVITGATITTAGTGYTSAPTVAFSGGGGSGAAGTATISGGAVTGITITNGGTGYTSAPTIAFSGGGGSGAAATATGWNTVSSITVTKGGAGYHTAPPVEIYASTSDTITTAATAHALVSNGQITSIVMDNVGAGYVNEPTIELELESIRSYVVDDGAANSDDDIYGYIVRVLTGVAFKSYSGSASNAGFKVGQIYSINETGDDGKAYAISGYFAEDYTFVGGSNDAYIRIAAVTTAGLPSAFTVVNPGSTFLNDTADINITSPSGETCAITLTTGYLFEYEGKYKDDRGKLSDVNVIQDNKRYQPYSYVIKSGIAQSTWDRAIRDAVHPSGMEVFGDLIIRSEVEFNTEFVVQTTGTIFYLFKSTDEAETSETMSFFVEKVISKTATVTEQIAKHFIPAGKTESVSGQDQGSVPYVVDGYWNDSTDGNDTDNYNMGDEQFTWVMGKVLSETISTSDSIDTGVSYIRTFTDGPTVADSKAFSVSRSLSDTLTGTADSLAIVAGRIASDSVSISDTNVVTFSKSPSETATATESLSRVWQHNETLSNSVSATEVISLGSSFDVTPDSVTATDSPAITYFRNVSETATTSDSHISQFNKPVSESISGSEAITSINTSKGVTETLTDVAESLVNALNKPATDSATTTDTGIGSMQDYVDPTYLSEDYVGQGWNFT